MMRIARPALDEVRQHVAEGYPHEICGMLVSENGSGLVTQTRRVRNRMVERARDRYEMDPRDQIRIQRECDAHGWEIVGYYHSHPDHPARASATDASRSWAGPIYVIVSCVGGRPEDANAFVADQDGGPMRPVPLEVVEPTS
jgi:proteasome lid subunit RPN8/RPN11